MNARRFLLTIVVFGILLGMQAGAAHSDLLVRKRLSMPLTIQEVSRWYGASITKPMSEPFGMQTFEQQLDLMLPATAVRIDLNYWAWRRDPTDNTLGLPYKQFLDKIADWSYARGISAIWSAHVFTRSSKNWGTEAKATFLLAGKLNTPNADNISEDWTGAKEANYTLSWADYTQWLTEIVERPKLRQVMSALDIFNEPPWIENPDQRQIAEDRYLEFMRQAIDAVRAVVPNLPIVAEGIPEWSPGFFLRPGKSLNRTDVIYALHYYAWYGDPWISDGRTETLIARAYAEGRYADGRKLMAQYFYQVGFFELQDNGYPILFTEIGTDPYLQESYWSRWTQDLYDIAKERNIGYLQHGFFDTPRPIPDPSHAGWFMFGMLNRDLVSLSDIGRLWRDSLTSMLKA